MFIRFSRSIQNQTDHGGIIKIYYTSMDRCIYELTFEHLKAHRNIHRNSNWIWVSYNILHYTMVNEDPELYLKASVFTADILHAKW